MLQWKEKLEAVKKKAGMKNICLLMLAAGLFLLSFSDRLFTKQESGEIKEETNQALEDTVKEAQEVEADAMEQKLEELLAAVKGVGKVRVMITLNDYGEKEILKDQQSSSSSLNETDASGGTRVNISSEQEETTIYDGENQPFVTRETAAKVSGILVICEGGGNSEVVFEIVSAAEALFGVPAHRIVVLEMK